MLLEYEKDLVREIAHQSCLTILANGLCSHDIAIELCKLYAEANMFVLVLNTSTAEQQYCFDLLKLRPSYARKDSDEIPAKKSKMNSTNDAIVNSRIRYISCQFGTAADRHQVYNMGGVFFMSSAPLVILDLLNNVLPADLVSGVLVPSAHQLVSSQDSNESAPISLAIRLLVEQNPGVFVTAITDRPSAIASESGAGLSRLASSLLVDRVLLRPRYESSVKRSFAVGSDEADVGGCSNSFFQITQLDVNLTNNMSQCHSLLLQLCSLCSRELRSALGSVSCLQRSDTIANQQLASSQMPGIGRNTRKPTLETEMEAIRLAKSVSRGGSWSLLPAKARNLSEDVVALRSLVASLLRDNPIVFFRKVMALTNDPQRRVSAGSSGWIAHSETILLEKAAKDRTGLGTGTGAAVEKPEILPMWESFEHVFHEVRTFSSDSDTLYAVVGYDDAHVAQLSSVLKMGAKQYMEYERQKYIEKQQQQQQSKTEFGRKKNPFKKGQFRRRKDNSDSDEDVLLPDSNRQIMWMRMKDPHLARLEELGKFLFSPQYSDRKNRVLILCANSLTLMRHIEKMSTQAQLANRSPGDGQLYVYWLSHRGTLEERDYLAGLAAEAAAFARLANDRAALAVSRDLVLSNARTTREEREADDGGNKVLVDVRELRSQMPGACHLRGLDIVPKTLLIADYVLTPDCGVERKALADLVSSIFSGRLYTQCTALTAAFSKPLLLIELPSLSASSFSSSSSWNIVLPRHTALAEIRSSLVLLVLRFPRLRLVWSPSPDQSAQFFVQMKRSQPDPVVDSANVTTNDDDNDSGSMLRTLEHLPAVTSRQARCLANNITNLRDLASKCKSGQLAAADGKIAAAIGQPAAKQLADFLSTDLSAAAMSFQQSLNSGH